MPDRCMPDAAGVKRCRAPATDACLAAGGSCGVADECCNGPCAPGEGPAACAGVCASDGARCTASSDCCDPTSECLRLASSLLCAQPLR
jgi:hypothetical protein